VVDTQSTPLAETPRPAMKYPQAELAVEVDGAQSLVNFCWFRDLNPRRAHLCELYTVFRVMPLQIVSCHFWGDGGTWRSRAMAAPRAICLLSCCHELLVRSPRAFNCDHRRVTGHSCVPTTHVYFILRISTSRSPFCKL
jgi:hypothetical protein